MPISEDKKKQFIATGYIEKPECLVFFKRESGKIFTKAYIDDHSINTLLSNIHEPHDPTNWKIYHSPDQKHFIQNYFKIFGNKP